jgi:hypothetical protein
VFDPVDGVPPVCQPGRYAGAWTLLPRLGARSLRAAMP